MIFCPYNKVNKRAKESGSLLAQGNEGPSTKGEKDSDIFDPHLPSETKT